MGAECSRLTATPAANLGYKCAPWSRLAQACRSWHGASQLICTSYRISLWRLCDYETKNQGDCYHWPM